MSELSDMRKSYEKQALLEDLVAPNPYEQFKKWFETARNTPEIYEANAMTIASVSNEGQPSARIVLLKGIEENTEKKGLLFYTNYHSRKGKELTENPKVSVLFYWGALQQQVRIEGEVKQLSPQKSTQYFQQRPKGSQIGAWASPQSQVIASRTILNDNLTELEAQYKDQEILPRPDHWGGYLIEPHYWEFWQGRPNRLHDRLCYTLQNTEEWTIERLAP